jgi:hypothetical protein
VKRCRKWIWILIAAGIAFLWIMWRIPATPDMGAETLVPTRSETPEMISAPTAGERLVEGYGDPASPPIEDLRKIHRVVGGYFSVIKDPARFPIGGNEDLSAALKGENPNREIFLPADHPIFGKEGQLIDRWGTPVIVHPEGWKQLGLRSAGEDRRPYTEDDLVLLPSGLQPR